jgi:hypothetical protein
VAYLAHVLGFLAGVLMALPLRRGRSAGPSPGWPPQPPTTGPITYR